MKQTVEEVAREAAEDCYECHYDDSLEMRLVKEAFRQGAEWQSKQSPWISVKERLPEELESVLVGTNYEGRYYYEVAFVMNGKWVCHNSKPIYWMPIPSFDDILEANRDVLERIKEKGFNEYCKDIIKEDDNRIMQSVFRTNKNLPKLCYSRPTQSVAQKWLRETKNIHICVYNCACGYGYEISKADNGTHITSSVYEGPNDGGK